jgi:putative ABC transport system permease protein
MISTLGFELVYGREFSKEIVSDSNTVLINESATSELLLPKDPVGEVLNGNLTIVGVIKDFNFESLERNIEPAVIRLADDGYRMAIKVSPGYEKQLVEDLNQEWLKYQSEEPLDYYFLESNFLEMLEKDEMTAKAIALFTGLAIFISCLGLFGLAAYTSEKRSKEIGIRKVLGASLGNINYILLSGFVKPVLLSFIIAGPAAYLIVKWWLQNFAYQVSLSWHVFATSFLVISLLSMLTVIYYAISLSRRNPIVSLKDE